MSEVVFSDVTLRIDWADTSRWSGEYGVKGATSLSIPRAWTPPFALLSVELAAAIGNGSKAASLMDVDKYERLRSLGGERSQLIVRSSVVGETIWDRGSYDSVPVDVSGDLDEASRRLDEAIRSVVGSSGGRPTGLMIQQLIKASAQGEFGNLQRISKTRDQWEVSTREFGDITSRQRLNSPRDQAAEPGAAIVARAGLARERLFGSIGAWLNNELLLGHPGRLNCEWLTDNLRFYIVQIDEEHEDIWGVNPFQVRIPPAVRPKASSGHYLKLADGAALGYWDKLQVLEQLWEADAAHKPRLFFVPFGLLPARATHSALAGLEADFRDLIGTAGIVVRTSVRAGEEKLPNLPRTECLTPESAARWCFAKKGELSKQGGELAFIAHRFLAARSSGWARAEPGNPMVEINTLWGLPDALQYCPYDIWEVHVPTGVATDYPDYKSDMLVAQPDGGWQYKRVKNELARSNSIGSTEAKEIAARSSAIADRLGQACHIMWFVGCAEEDGTAFNVPWYWTPAHKAERNSDRSNYRIFTVVDKVSLARFSNWSGSRNRQALSLRPNNLDLMRDVRFIEAVGAAAIAAQVPVVLSGSTLAHAYYQLRKLGCTVITPSEKEYSRTRRSTNLGKLVRDMILERITQRREANVTRQISGNLRKGFLIGKLLEEALEVREAVEPAHRLEEFADVYEVLRALVAGEGISFDSVVQAADEKKRKAGGFDRGLVLMQTSILASDRTGFSDPEKGLGEVLSQQTAGDAIMLPFSFFGFMEMDQPRSVYLEDLGLRVDIVLRPDRLELQIVREPEQLGLPLI